MTLDLDSLVILALKPGHDGSAAIIEGGRLVASIEGEKDSHPRLAELHVEALLQASEFMGRPPDVIAMGGWFKPRVVAHRDIGAGYDGLTAPVPVDKTMFGMPVKFLTSSHERSHIMCALGMAPPPTLERTVVLNWEGHTGCFYDVDARGSVVSSWPVLRWPGARYSCIYALANPDNADLCTPRGHDAGKVMALAAYGDPHSADRHVQAAVDRILRHTDIYRIAKHEFAGLPLADAGIEAQVTKDVAAVLSRRMFEIFHAEIVQRVPAGLPLRIGGGCGLNCDWNTAWRDCGHFSDVFVPPCTNDSGSAIGTGIDAMHALTGQLHIEWSVYGGLGFMYDCNWPDDVRRVELDLERLAASLADGQVVAWVQGRTEIGPRALGNRSLLAAPFAAESRARLNKIKVREGYRPIAPVCLEEDLRRHFDDAMPDPYMLYFRRVSDDRLQAVRHVDGSARCQSVTQASNAELYALLRAFRTFTGVGVLCNTSLNFNSYGFINKLSDLVRYCRDRGVENAVVGTTWLQFG